MNLADFNISADRNIIDEFLSYDFDAEIDWKSPIPDLTDSDIDSIIDRLIPILYYEDAV